MRLPPEQQAAIRTAAAEAFGEDVGVWLFGSRADDSWRGGDIDLLVRPGPAATGLRATFQDRPPLARPVRLSLHPFAGRHGRPAHAGHPQGPEDAEAWNTLRRFASSLPTTTPTDTPDQRFERLQAAVQAAGRLQNILEHIDHKLQAWTAKTGARR